MKNNFLQEAYGGLREARSKHYCLGLPRKWKVMTSTLLLLFTFAIGNVWAANTPAAAGTYVLNGKKPGNSDRFYKLGNGVYVHRRNNSSWTDGLGMKTTSTQTNGVVVYITSSMNMSGLVKKQSTNTAVTVQFDVYTFDATTFESFETGTENSTTVAVTLPATPTYTSSVSFAALGTAAAEEESSDNLMLAAGYYYIVPHETSNVGKTFLYSITLSSASTDPTAPSITAPASDPDLQTITQGETKQFTITTTGYPAPTYQWYKNSSKSTTGAEEIDGATAASYTTPSTLAASDDNYYFYCVATNASGTAQSPYFSLKVNELGSDLTKHEPGVYTKATDAGGWGQTLATQVVETKTREYEIYGMSSASSTNFWWAGTKSTTPANANCLSTEGFTTDFAANKITGAWMKGSVTSRGTSYGPSSSVEEFPAVSSYYSVKLNTTDKSVMIKVQGYDQISFLGKDNKATDADNKHLVVKVNGVEQSMTLSTDWSIRRFGLDASKVNVIEVTGCTASADNHLAAFSLRLPTCEEVAAPTSLSCTAQTVNSLTFGWTKAEHAEGYVATLYSNEGCTSEVDSKNLGDVNTVTFTGLSNSTTYYCKVQSKGNGTTYCEDGGVTAAANGTTETPSCGVVTPPTFLQAGSITAEGATLLVTDAADAMNYEFYISEESTEPETSATATHTSTTKEKAITGLTSGTTYYVWVRSVCDADHKSIWVALDEDKFKVKAEPTTTFANGIYVLGGSALDLSALIANNNSAGAITYEITDAGTTSASISTAAFSATAMGTATVQATQAAYGDFAEKVMSATITVLDDELSDTYIWSKASKYGGDGKCISGSAANVDPNANAALTSLNYSSLTMENATSMGRPGDNKVVTLTFTATQEGFAIKDICTFGKLEEALGGQIRWDDGEWTALAKYGSGDGEKKTFSAPAGTLPTTFSIRFTSASSSEGGLWWRNALVTLEVKKTVSSVTETLVGAEINGAAISSENLATLLEDKTLDIATAYAAAPTVTFKKQVTTSYEGGWAPDVTNVDVEVTASDNTTAWQASATINAQAYTVTLAKPTEPSLETAATSFMLTSTKNATDSKSFTFSGMNLTSGNVTIGLESPVAGMTVSPTEVTPTAGVITDQEVTITYKSLENVAEANVNLIVSYSETVKLTIPLTYSSTRGWDTPNNVTGSITWDFSKAASSDVTISNSEVTVLANYDVENDPTKIVTDNLAGKGEKFSDNWLRTFYLQFTTTVNGRLAMEYSDTGSSSGRRTRYMYVNGVRYGAGSNTSASHTLQDPVYVTAGTITLTAKIDTEGKEEAQWNDANVQLYQMVFVQTHDITFVDGGSIPAIHAANGETVSLPAVDPSDIPTGKAFEGWYNSSDVKVGNAGDDYTMGDEDVTLTAKFSAPAETPVINTQPAGTAYCAGNEPTLSVGVNAVSDGGTLHYAWFKVGEPDAAVGTDAASYTVESAGTYYVKVTNRKEGYSDAIVTSNNAVVTLNVAAAITTQPTGQTDVVSGSSVTLSVVATNATGYQWYSCDDAEKHGAAAISGAEAADYVFTCTANGYYYCEVGNVCGDAILSNVVSVKLEPEGCNTFASKPVDEPYNYEQTGEWTFYNVDSNGADKSTDNVFTDGKNFNDDDVVVANTRRFALKFEKDVESVTLYGVGGNDKSFTKLSISDEMTKNTYTELTTTATKVDVADKQHVFTVENVIIPAGKYAWFEFSGSLNFFKICYTEGLAKPVIPTLSNQELCSGESYAEIDATSTKTGEGTLSYQWYDATDEEHPVVIDGANSATFTPTADGKYYVEVTNAAAGHVSNKAKSNTITMAHFASAAITTAPENVRMDAGQNATLTVVASGKNLSYEWFTCDDEMGTNPVAIVPAETNASLAVTVTAGMNQYYKVVVYSDCGNASAVALVEEWHELPQVSVSATTTWDWQYAATTKIAPEKDVEILMANIKNGANKMTNDETFNSQALLFQGQEAYIVENSRAFAKGGHIKFTTTVPGKVTVEFSDNGDNNRKLKINDAISTESSSSKTDVKTFSAVVPAGEVVLMGVKNDGTGTDQYIRISKIIFDTNPDLTDADYTRNVTEGRFGTICLPNGGIMVGAELFEIAYYGATSEKIFFDNIPSGEMEAGIPYIFLPKAGVSQLGVFYTDAANASAGSRNGLIGSYTQETITPDDDNYILLNNQYCKVVSTEGAVYVGANRAYIHLTSINPTEPALAPGRRRISMGVQGQNAATGMDELNASETPVKMLIDGQLFILRGEKMYNANGQLVK